MKKLGLLIILMMTSFISFSQNDIDTLSIRLEKPVAKLVIKDLITGDEAKEELGLSVKKFQLLEQKIVLKDSVITNLNDQISNFNTMISTKQDQLNLSQELSKKLQKDLKKQKLKTKLAGGAGVVAVIAVAVLLK
jgi:uncharacterized coiled-coil protein SlyX|tara:strand:+ start:36 stop:440 length:405 start_codon:yes stop_codon:yes gene_type:complete